MRTGTLSEGFDESLKTYRIVRLVPFLTNTETY